MRMALSCAVLALSCHASSYNAAGAAANLAIGLGASAVSRANGGCYAVCQQGEQCNEKTGLGEARSVVLIAGAMAVRARFYGQFAQYLSEQGAAALTFDYRGIGGSRPPGPLKQFQVAFHDWAEKDLGGAVDFLGRRFPQRPLK